MFIELNNLLDIDCDRYPSNKSIGVVSENDITSAVLHHFVSFTAKSKRILCLVTLQQTKSHYSNVSNKFGVNFQRHELIHVDLMSYLQNVFLSCSDSADAVDPCKDIKCVFDLVQRSVADVIESNEVLVIFDDLTPLMAVGFRDRDVFALVHFLHSWLQQQQNLTLVTNVTTNCEDESSVLLARYLAHHSDVTVRLTPLPTGHSKHVHGQVTVSSK